MRGSDRGGERGAFNAISAAPPISRRKPPQYHSGLREGLMYSEACARVGYDHAARPAISLDQINSPVTRRGFREAIKQIRAVAREFGPIDSHHVELARDVGKSAEERAKLTDGIEERNGRRIGAAKEAAELLRRAVSD